MAWPNVHPVRLGAQSVQKVEILDGLNVGDQVVVSGSDAFNGADRVIVHSLGIRRNVC